MRIAFCKGEASTQIDRIPKSQITAYGYRILRKIIRFGQKFPKIIGISSQISNEIASARDFFHDKLQFTRLLNHIEEKASIPKSVQPLPLCERSTNRSKGQEIECVSFGRSEATHKSDF